MIFLFWIVLHWKSLNTATRLVLFCQPSNNHRFSKPNQSEDLHAGLSKRGWNRARIQWRHRHRNARARHQIRLTWRRRHYARVLGAHGCAIARQIRHADAREKNGRTGRLDLWKGRIEKWRIRCGVLLDWWGRDCGVLRRLDEQWAWRRWWALFWSDSMRCWTPFCLVCRLCSDRLGPRFVPGLAWPGWTSKRTHEPFRLLIGRLLHPGY